MDVKQRLAKGIRDHSLPPEEFNFDPRMVVHRTRSKRFSNLAALQARFRKNAGVKDV